MRMTHSGSIRFIALAALVATVAAVVPSAATGQASTVVILVRHGEKASAGGADPQLSSAGEARAKALAAALADAGVSGIIVSPFKRTHATAAPLAERLGITPEEIPLVGVNGMPGYAATVATAIQSRYSGGTVLVVGHSNTLAPIIAALGGPKLADLCDEEYSTLYTLVLPPTGPPHLIRASYGAPDRPHAGDCARTMRQP